MLKISVQILYFKDGWYSFRSSCDCGPRKCTSIFIEVVEHSWKSSVRHINIVESGKENLFYIKIRKQLWWLWLLSPLAFNFGTILNSPILSFTFFLKIAGHYINAALKIWYIHNSKYWPMWNLSSVQWFWDGILCWI